MKKDMFLFFIVLLVICLIHADNTPGSYPQYVYEPVPDLYIEGRLTIYPKFPKIGEKVTISAVIKNTGKTSPCPLKAKLKITGPTGFHKTINYFELPCHLIEMGEQRIYDFSFTRTFSKMRVYKATLTIDVNNELNEQNENNNEKSRYFRMDPLPDLALYVPPVKPVNIGHKRTVTVEVKNIGPGLSPKTKLRFFLDAEGTKSYFIPPLRKNESKTFKRSHRWFISGKKLYNICVDCDNEIRELDENNNVVKGWVDVNILSSGSLNTEYNPCNLKIFFSAPNKVKKNEKVSIIAKIKNTSSARKSQPAKIEFRIQDHRTITFHIPELFPKQTHEAPYSVQWSVPGTKQFSAKITSGKNCERSTGSIIVEALQLLERKNLIK